MFHKPLNQILCLLLLALFLALPACAPFVQIASTSGSPPTPVVVYQQGGVNNPDIYVDPAAFRSALLEALAGGDQDRLALWMADPFLTGVWRTGLSETTPAQALEALAAGQLALVEGADLKGLLGGRDPLSIPPGEAVMADAFLVSGWGPNGRDEALLFIARQPDNSLKLRGWMVIQGGFSGARLGGAQPYANPDHGYSLYLPAEHTATRQAENSVVILPPGEGPGRGIAWIKVEPANGRTTHQVVEAVIAELGSGFNISSAPLSIEDAQALVLTGMPGQDSNSQVFMVHGDRLYHLTFSPDDPEAGEAYRQMVEMYAMITNTFHFTE